MRGLQLPNHTGQLDSCKWQVRPDNMIFIMFHQVY